MAATDFLDNELTAWITLELAITVVSFGGLLAIFWIGGEIPYLQFSMAGFLNDHGLILFLALFIYRLGTRAFNTVMQGA